MSKKVVIIGGGFGGIAVARALKKADVQITLIDKNNHHLFLPLLYQVATAVLDPSDVAFPIRDLLRKQKNTWVVMDEAENVDIKARQVYTGGGKYAYDYLVIACGLRSSYFGRDEWGKYAPSLKTLGDAIEIREKMLHSLEKMERGGFSGEGSLQLTYVVVGGGPTGVEVAGGLAGIKRGLLKDFKNIDPASIRIVLLEALDRILGGFSPLLSANGEKALEALGVEVRLNVRITDVNASGIQTDSGFIETEDVVWAAGARAQALTRSVGAETDTIGRILVDSCCSIPEYPEVFVIGDSSVYKYEGKSLPALAPVAIQQGKYVSGIIKGELQGKTRAPFKYKDKGSMAIIGRYKAVLQRGRLEISGYPAWLIWTVLHSVLVQSIRGRCMIMLQWLCYYATNRRRGRLITGRQL
jgi:NADH dehydrogenase